MVTVFPSRGGRGLELESSMTNQLIFFFFFLKKVKHNNTSQRMLLCARIQCFSGAWTLHQIFVLVNCAGGDRHHHLHGVLLIIHRQKQAVPIAANRSHMNGSS